jgi:hypothetical protein
LSRDLLCFSHLRWDFVYQRPNHLMARAARDRRVFFFEEPTFDEGGAAGLDLAEREGVTVVTPRLPSSEMDHPEESLRRLVDDLVRLADIKEPVLWYYTPMALEWSDHLARSLTVFDCMDHLAGFKDAPPGLIALEGRLLDRADLVLTGGAQLYAAKRRSHTNVHCFPSSVDVAHFRKARRGLLDPTDQTAIPHPRFGYCGVIDERLDLDLVAATAASRPEWQFVMIGPVVKIDPADLPQAVNIHYLGMKRYEELPAYLGAWDVGIMPFAHNDATRYISPTKTPEYLAAGLRVVSTSIHDVVEPYGRNGLAQIGDGAAGFLEACTQALATDIVEHRHSADAFLAQNSWDRTWASIDTLIATALERRSRNRRTELVAAGRPALLGTRPIPAGAVSPAAAAATAMRPSPARRAPTTASRTNGKPVPAGRTNGKAAKSSSPSVPAATTPLVRQRPASTNAGTLARVE